MVFWNSLSFSIIQWPMVFLVVIYGCKSWTIKKAEHWRIDAFELWCWRRPLRVPWTARKSNQYILKEISPGYSLRADVEAETPIIWAPDMKNWLIWKDPNAGKDWGQEKGMTEDEMVGWHHQLNGHEFRWTPGVGNGQGGLSCCGSRGHKESDTAEWLNWTEVEAVTHFIFLGSKITANGDCSHEIKRRLLLGRKAMTNLACMHSQALQ